MECSWISSGGAIGELDAYVMGLERNLALDAYTFEIGPAYQLFVDCGLSRSVDAVLRSGLALEIGMLDRLGQLGLRAQLLFAAALRR